MEDKKDDSKIDVKKLIKDMSSNFSGSNEEQMKAVQLLKGLATSDDKLANDFMKALDKATTEISKEMSDEKKESVENSDETIEESVLENQCKNTFKENSFKGLW